MRFWWLCFGFLSILSACNHKSDTLFTKLSSRETGVDFNNTLREDDPELSIVTYPYFYNGGGVAIGDINNDGMEDIFFTGNMVKNGLFLNKGNLKFENISSHAGISDSKSWCTGVTMVDINADGWLDIYVCRSGWSAEKDRTNLLFINNHDLTFTESAAKFGIDDAGYSTQASFFDYDLDGDLDLFVINQSTPKFSRGFMDYIQARVTTADSAMANKLYRNDAGLFTNVSDLAGIHSNIFTFSLGLSTADINQDGWPDIYVSNDFEEEDYLYLNNHDGRFSYTMAQKIDHGSLYGMGVDIADYNNDLLPDIIELDMLPEGNYAQKMHMGGDNFNRYNYQFRNGMFYQFMANTLQKNNGDGTFSEIGQFAGIARTDWSWSPLVADLDNDGFKDLFITNGYKRDNTDMQFMGYAMDQSIQAKRTGNKANNVQEYISHMPGIKIPNYVFKNLGKDHFENKIKDWGFDQNTFSHGAAYADLDNDGDLELIINNTDEESGIYRNNSELITKNNFLKIKLAGSTGNPAAIGARIYAYSGTDQFYVENAPVRGFQSSVSSTLQLGLGNHSAIDSLRVIWPDQTSQLILNSRVNTTLTLRVEDSRKYHRPSKVIEALMKERVAPDYRHRENETNDFTKQFLLPHFFSHNGPCMTLGDINGDGLPDIFVGGAKGQAGSLFLQSKDHQFTEFSSPAIAADSASEDVDAVFFDADGDHDMDLYVVSGGYEFPTSSPLLQDRLYLNNGKGVFMKSQESLPENASNKKCVRSVDFDQDGDLDLFIGASVSTGNFPLAYASKIYFNDGKGNFTKTKPANASLGIVNDALWIDLDKDGKKDLIVAGEWMPLKAFLTKGALFTDVSAQWFPFASNGLWNCLASGDFDNDGDIDLIAGNYGLNSPLKADADHLIQLYQVDIDGNGSVDPLITHFVGNESVPLALHDDLLAQVPILKKKFLDYSIYAKATVKDILTEEQIAKSPVLKVNLLSSVYLENTGKNFIKKDLPAEAQFSSLYAMSVADLNKDGNLDIVVAGNNRYNRIYLGNQDANHGVVLLGDGKGNFNYLSQSKSGLKVRGDVRSIVLAGDQLIFGVNNSRVKAYQLQPGNNP